MSDTKLNAINQLIEGYHTGKIERIKTEINDLKKDSKAGWTDTALHLLGAGSISFVSTVMAFGSGFPAPAVAAYTAIAALTAYSSTESVVKGVATQKTNNAKIAELDKEVKSLEKVGLALDKIDKKIKEMNFSELDQAAYTEKVLLLHMGGGIDISTSLIVNAVDLNTGTPTAAITGTATSGLSAGDLSSIQQFREAAEQKANNTVLPSPFADPLKQALTQNS